MEHIKLLLLLLLVKKIDLLKELQDLLGCLTATNKNLCFYCCVFIVCVCGFFSLSAECR